MKTEVSYIAFDGKRFNSKEECQKYENENSNAYVKFFDKAGNPVPFTRDSFESTYFIFLSPRNINFFASTLSNWKQEAAPRNRCLYHPEDFYRPGLYILGNSNYEHYNYYDKNTIKLAEKILSTLEN